MQLIENYSKVNISIVFWLFYYILSIGPNGLRGCADRIVQNAEQRALNRYSHNRADNTTTTNTTISRTYINATGSNYDYRESNITTDGVRSPVNQPPPSSNYYHTLSNTYRNIPVREESIRNSPTWNNTAHEYNLRDSTIRDYSSRDTTNRNSSIRDSRSSSRESSVRENPEYENQQSSEHETLLDT